MMLFLLTEIQDRGGIKPPKVIGEKKGLFAILRTTDINFGYPVLS